VIPWALVVLGFVIIVTQSRLFRPLRDWALGGREASDPRAPKLGVLLHCPMCFGWWAGAMLSAAGFVGPSLFVCPASWPTWLLLGARAWADGCAASALCWCAHVVLVRLGASEL
jgi:hypothetical protein